MLAYFFSNRDCTDRRIHSQLDYIREEEEWQFEHCLILNQSAPIRIQYSRRIHRLHSQMASNLLKMKSQFKPRGREIKRKKEKENRKRKQENRNKSHLKEVVHFHPEFVTSISKHQHRY